jgi:hypothetical protein
MQQTGLTSTIYTLDFVILACDVSDEVIYYDRTVLCSLLCLT